MLQGDPPPTLSEAYHPALHRARIEPDHRNVIPQRRYPLRGLSHSLAPSTENVSSGTWEHCSLRLLGPGLVHPLNSKELLGCGWYHVACSEVFPAPMVSYSCQRFHVLFLGTAAVALISAQAQTASASRPRISVETITGSQSLRDGIEIQAGTASLRIIALRDDILRVRVAPGGALPEDASWAVLAGPRSKSVDVQPSGDAASVGFHTGSLDVRVERTPLRL